MQEQEQEQVGAPAARERRRRGASPVKAERVVSADHGAARGARDDERGAVAVHALVERGGRPAVLSGRVGAAQRLLLKLRACARRAVGGGMRRVS